MATHGASQVATRTRWSAVPADDPVLTAKITAGLLLARHGSTLTAGQLERLIRRTEGWAAGLCLAALSLDAHPDPDQFLRELAAEDSA